MSTTKIYSEKLRNPLWQKRRLEILSRDKFTCTSCGETESTLHVHHLKYADQPWDAQDEDLTTLCEQCHSIIESIKKVAKNIEVLKIDKIKITPLFSLFIVHTTDGLYINECFDKRLTVSMVILDHSVAMKVAESIINFNTIPSQDKCRGIK